MASSSLFKNSLISTIGVFFLIGFFFRLYLSNASYVPAWVPPPLCPCWDSNNFKCQTASNCDNPLQIAPTPTPYLSPLTSSSPANAISGIDISSDCKITVHTTDNTTQTLSLPSSRTLSNSTCSQVQKIYYSPNRQIAVFENDINPDNPSIAAFFTSINKVISLQETNSQKILDAIFLPDSHLVVLLSQQLRTYDINSLLNTFPGNVDLYQNKFSSVSLQSTTMQLQTTSVPAASLQYKEGEVFILGSDQSEIANFNVVRLHPRSSCPCWDNQNNYCLPQASCSGQTP